MSTLEEIRTALAVIALAWDSEQSGVPTTSDVLAHRTADFARIAQRITLLQCTTAYPTPVGDANLRAMDTLRRAFCVPVGFSDHTSSVHVAVAAAALGATVVEKHLTLDRNLRGPDHRASTEPAAFATLVAGIRDAEEALGEETKRLAESEAPNLVSVRRSLVAAKPILAGEAFTMENVTAKRPATGVSPMRIWDVLGTTASRDYERDEPLDG